MIYITYIIYNIPLNNYRIYIIFLHICNSYPVTIADHTQVESQLISKR